MERQLANLSSAAIEADRNPAAVYLAGLAPTGRRTMRGRLKVVADMLDSSIDALPWHTLRYQHLEALRAKLQERYSAHTTVNATLAALRGVARASFNLGLMSADDYQRLKNAKGVKGERLPAGRSLTAGEIGALLDTCDTTPTGKRDAAVIALMYAGGLRRNEVVSLALGDYSPETGELKVKGKGNKERLLYVNNGAAEALSDWLGVRGLESGPLFVRTLKGGKLTTEGITSQAVYNMLNKRADKAGVARFSPHDLRRTFVSELLDAGADISTVQQLAGHASVQTTARYDRRGNEAKKKAVSLLHVPYRRKT